MAEHSTSKTLRQALRHHQGGRLAEAETLYRQILSRDPRCADALHLLGVIVHQAGQHATAAELIGQAATLAPKTPAIHANLGEVYRHLGRLDEAIASYRQALALQPNFPVALNNLGNAFAAQGRPDESIPHYRRALAQQPKYPEALNNLGIALADQGQFDEAITFFEKALALEPGYAGAHNNLGNVFNQQGRFDDAIACYQRALALKPDYAGAHTNLGNVFNHRGQFDDAIACYQRALALQPDLVDAHNNLGTALKYRGRPDEALDCFQRAFAHNPDFANTLDNLGNLYKDRGQLDEAIIWYRRALALRPDRADIHSNLILALHYHAGSNVEAATVELRRWNERHARPLAPQIKPHGSGREPDRRLRIGYVSPDFRDHVVGHNLLPLFQRHARDQFEIFSYARVLVPDGVTAKFRACSDHWRDTQSCSEPQTAETIRHDRIDILVDLSLHTARNSLLVFARKPAPIQVSFAGYPGKTGLDTIDYHLTDPYLEPPGPDDAVGSDAPFHLPHSFWCYEAGSQEPPVLPPPALANGHLTFGCLNYFGKVNDFVLQLWARVLLAVPRSRILLLVVGNSLRQLVLNRLSQLGVSVDRVTFADFAPRQDYLTNYHRIDLGLDTFPYNGHTTSLDSYWMGVPVASLVGPNSVSRAGLSQLSNLGLPGLAAHTTDEFVGIASALANDIPRLTALRAGLRERMRHSPLMDATSFTRAVEAAYRTMWRRWCTQPPRPSPTNGQA